MAARDEARYREAETRLWIAYGAQPTEGRLHLARNDVTVRIQEIGDGPPVLFLHGANTSGASWVALASRPFGYHSILLDRPGTGRALIERLPNATLEVLPGAGHAPWLDDLDHSVRVVRRSLGAESGAP